MVMMMVLQPRLVNTWGDLITTSHTSEAQMHGYRWWYIGGATPRNSTRMGNFIKLECTAPCQIYYWQISTNVPYLAVRENVRDTVSLNKCSCGTVDGLTNRMKPPDMSKYKCNVEAAEPPECMDHITEKQRALNGKWEKREMEQQSVIFCAVVLSGKSAMVVYF